MNALLCLDCLIPNASTCSALLPRQVSPQRHQTVGLLDAMAHLSVMPSACAPDCNTPHTKQELAAGATRHRSAFGPGTRPVADTHGPHPGREDGTTHRSMAAILRVPEHRLQLRLAHRRNHAQVLSVVGCCVGDATAPAITPPVSSASERGPFCPLWPPPPCSQKRRASALLAQNDRHSRSPIARAWAGFLAASQRPSSRLGQIQILRSCTINGDGRLKFQTALASTRCGVVPVAGRTDEEIQEGQAWCPGAQEEGDEEGDAGEEENREEETGAKARAHSVIAAAENSRRRSSPDAQEEGDAKARAHSAIADPENSRRRSINHHTITGSHLPFRRRHQSLSTSSSGGRQRRGA
jgi:hypothetical protein